MITIELMEEMNGRVRIIPGRDLWVAPQQVIPKHGMSINKDMLYSWMEFISKYVNNELKESCCFTLA